jgi:hypothetical protein
LFFFPPVRMFQKSSSKTFLRFWMDIDLVFQHPFSVYFLSGGLHIRSPPKCVHTGGERGGT